MSIVEIHVPIIRNWIGVEERPSGATRGDRAGAMLFVPDESRDPCYQRYGENPGDYRYVFFALERMRALSSKPYLST